MLGNGGLAQRARDGVRSMIAALDIVADEAAEARLLRRLLQPSRAMVMSFVNQHAVNLAWSKPDFAAVLCGADVLLRDGLGLEVGLRMLGQPSGRNMNGTDFIPKLARAYAGRKVALFGTAEPWTARAAAALRQLGCDVVSTMDGFQAAADYSAEVARTVPALVILAMGMPKQERVAAAIAAAAPGPMVIVNGGAIADFLAERFPRAPEPVRAMRLEWLYRLALEPRRLAGRYLNGGAAFAWRIMLLRAQTQRLAAMTPVRDDVLMIGGDGFVGHMQ